LVYLLDSSIYVFRAWQTQPSAFNTHNELFHAVIGFTETLVNILTREHPQWIAAAFDTRNRQAIRYRIHPEYKAKRSPSPPELAIQFQRCQQVCEALAVPALADEEIEADDIIGQMAILARENEQRVTVISADKDLAQFIEEHDVYWNLAQNTRSTYQQLTKRFGVRPQQIADLLALCGDKTDNIPGVPGVGVATAAKVLHKWGNLDGVMANLDGVAAMRFRGAPHVAVLLAEYENTIRLARKLTGLIRSDTLPKTLNALAYEPPNPALVIEKLANVGFTKAAATDITKRFRVNPI